MGWSALTTLLTNSCQGCPIIVVFGKAICSFPLIGDPEPLRVVSSGVQAAGMFIARPAIEQGQC
jgi:hypothetical protein